MLMTFRIMTVTVIGFKMGKTIRQNTPNFDAPSMVAASSSDFGIVLTKPWDRNTAILELKPICMKIKPPRVFKKGIPVTSINVSIHCIKGIMIVWNGMSIVEIKIIKMILLNLLSVLASIQAVIEDRMTIKITDVIVMNNAF